MPSPQWSAAADRAAASVDEVPHWPPPITERLPRRIDADRNGNVQVLTRDGWELCDWADVAEGGQGWQHTPIWELVVDPREAALELVRRLALAVGDHGSLQMVTAEIRSLVGGIHDALELRG